MVRIKIRTMARTRGHYFFATAVRTVVPTLPLTLTLK